MRHFLTSSSFQTVGFVTLREGHYLVLRKKSTRTRRRPLLSPPDLYRLPLPCYMYIGGCYFIQVVTSLLYLVYFVGLK